MEKDGEKEFDARDVGLATKRLENDKQLRQVFWSGPIAVITGFLRRSVIKVFEVHALTWFRGTARRETGEGILMSRHRTLSSNWTDV